VHAVDRARKGASVSKEGELYAVTVDGELELLCHSANDAIAQRDAWRHDQPNDIQAVVVSIEVLRTLEHDDV